MISSVILIVSFNSTSTVSLISGSIVSLIIDSLISIVSLTEVSFKTVSLISTLSSSKPTTEIFLFSIAIVISFTTKLTVISYSPAFSGAKIPNSETSTSNSLIFKLLFTPNSSSIVFAS